VKISAKIDFGFEFQAHLIIKNAGGSYFFGFTHFILLFYQRTAFFALKPGIFLVFKIFLLTSCFTHVKFVVRGE